MMKNCGKFYNYILLHTLVILNVGFFQFQLLKIQNKCICTETFEKRKQSKSENSFILSRFFSTAFCLATNLSYSSFIILVLILELAQRVLPQVFTLQVFSLYFVQIGCLIAS